MLYESLEHCAERRPWTKILPESGQIWGGFSSEGVAPRNVQMTRTAYEPLAVLIKSNSEAEVS